MKRKNTLLLTTLLCIFLLSACGGDNELSIFKTSFEEFCEDVAEIDSAINNIDADSENAPAELLTYLDQLEVEFQELAALKMPEEFAYMEELADEASENMGHAVENYHEAFESEIYDEYAANIASQYYERAYKRVQYMITFMHGEVPNDENVSISIVEE